MHPLPTPPRVAIVCDWLDTYAGAERVIEQMLNAYPAADVFAVVDFVPEADRHFLQHKTVKTSFIQQLPLARRHYRHYLPLMPLAMAQLDLSAYDIILSSSHAVAKGILCGPDQLHISYVHSPLRYAWDMQGEYLAQSGLQRGLKSWLARIMLHRLRQWDAVSHHGVDVMLANSAFIARRIAKCYRRQVAVLHPPVDVGGFSLHTDKSDYYVTVSRLVPYKRTDIIVNAFARMPDKKLVVIGDGPEMARLAAIRAPNVSLLGYQTQAQVVQALQQAKAFLFASREDFGIAPLEAQACGTPVIAFGQGGALETVRGLDHPEATGLFFQQQTPQAIMDAVTHFEQQAHRFTPHACRAQAERFAPERFRAQLMQYVDQAWQALKAGEYLA